MKKLSFEIADRPTPKGIQAHTKSKLDFKNLSFNVDKGVQVAVDIVHFENKAGKYGKPMLLIIEEDTSLDKAAKKALQRQYENKQFIIPTGGAFVSSKKENLGALVPHDAEGAMPLEDFLTQIKFADLDGIEGIMEAVGRQIVKFISVNPTQYPY